MHAHPGGVAISTLVDLCTAKARLSIDSTDTDAVIQSVLDGAERAVVVFLGYDPSSAAATEYYSGDGSEFIVLRRKPVTTVTSVYADAGGRYGQSDDPFPSTSLLTEGTDYSVRIDGGTQTGILVRHGAFWPYAHRRPIRRLGWEVSPEFGSVKVTYTAGYTPAQLADIAEAIYQESAARWSSRFNGMGPFQSESLDGYSRSLGSGGSSSESMVSPFVSPIARDMLRAHRSIPWSA
jgi:hypothetical protein